MISYQEARTLIDTVAKRRTLEVETVPLLEATGRVCAQDLVSPEISPPFANSSMDGFAVRSQHTAQASSRHPLRFSVVGRLSAGDAPPQRPRQDGVWEIMTGAPFPEGFDASVKIEDVLLVRNRSGEVSEIEIKEPVMAKQNWRAAGEDFQVGTSVLKFGRMITPEHILALSSLGIGEVPVFRKLRVGLISTGRELVPVGEKPLPGQIRNSTAPYLLSTLKSAGVEVVHFATVLDEPEIFYFTMKRALAERYDLILTTGAVSMGKFDFVAEQLVKLGANMFFHKVAIRPGKPLLFCEFENGPVLFGLPGNPVSGVVGIRFFVDAYIRKLNKMKNERPMKARLSEGLKKPQGLRCFYKAHLALEESGAKVVVSGGQMSSLVSPLTQATAWVILPEEDAALDAGSAVDVYPLHFSCYDWRENHVGHKGTHSGGCC